MDEQSNRWNSRLSEHLTHAVDTLATGKGALRERLAEAITYRLVHLKESESVIPQDLAPQLRAINASTAQGAALLDDEEQCKKLAREVLDLYVEYVKRFPDYE